jgi:hypothetical protein
MAEQAVEHGTGEARGGRAVPASHGARSAISGSMRSAMVIVVSMDAVQSRQGNGRMTAARGMGKSAEGC